MSWALPVDAYASFEAQLGAMDDRDSARRRLRVPPLRRMQHTAVQTLWWKALSDLHPLYPSVDFTLNGRNGRMRVLADVW